MKKGLISVFLFLEFYISFWMFVKNWIEISERFILYYLKLIWVNGLLILDVK